MSNQSSLKRHGDDKLMVMARRNFLSEGFYEELCRKICETVGKVVPRGKVIADVGCGEGYYSKAICSSGEYCFFGIDISKDALKYAAKSIKEGQFAVASAFKLPFENSSVDCVMNIFAPSAYDEFHRILKEDGVLIKAVPLEEHLWGLKCAVYDKPYKNKAELRNDVLFNLVSTKEIKYNLCIKGAENIMNLFKMTPYCYKTSRQDTEKISKLTELSTTVHFAIEIYKRK